MMSFVIFPMAIVCPCYFLEISRLIAVQRLEWGRGGGFGRWREEGGGVLFQRRVGKLTWSRKVNRPI